MSIPRFVCLFVVVHGLIGACIAGPAGDPPILTPAEIPTLTVTTSPPARTWTAGPVLIEFKVQAENPAPFGVSRVPDSILYADGRLFIPGEGDLLTSQLSQEAVCGVLNTIEDAGFFDVDMEAYNAQVDARALGLTSLIRIEVNAWRRRSITAEALPSLLDDPNAEVPDPLHKTYHLLSNYRPDDLQPYRDAPLALAIHRCPIESACETETVWPLESPTLTTLFKRAEETGVKNREWGFGVRVSDQEAASVAQVLDRSGSRTFFEDNETYRLSARRLLPYESLESAMAYEARIPSPEVSVDSFAMTCEVTP